MPKYGLAHNSLFEKFKNTRFTTKYACDEQSSRNFPRLCHTNIDGSKGGQGHVSLSIQFLLFSCSLQQNILPNNRFLPQTQQLAPPGKSWIRHCSETAYDKTTFTVTNFLQQSCVFDIFTNTQIWQ